MGLDVTESFGTTTINDLHCLFRNPVTFLSDVVFIGQCQFQSTLTTKDTYSKNWKKAGYISASAPPLLISGEPGATIQSYLISLVDYYFPNLVQQKELAEIVHTWLTTTCSTELQKAILNPQKKSIISIACHAIYFFKHRHEPNMAKVCSLLSFLQLELMSEEICRVMVGQINCLHSCISNFLFPDLDCKSKKTVNLIVERLLQAFMVHETEFEIFLD